MAVLDLVAILVVADMVVLVAAAVVEVLVAGVEVAVAEGAIVGTGDAHPLADAGHMVDHRIDQDAHARGPAALDHVDERLAVAAARGQRVAHRLVAGPPGAVDALQGDVLVGRRDLDGVDAGRPQVSLTLRGDVVPAPLEEMNDHR
ncbi:hypothetical protein [Halomonas sp. BM-2019]|uniref:hypothetical protein n=1 Tax=Halomonas sp. BM-2019 TaxID=2811227 RepID=UPI001B3C3EE0|nr:MAG: hypothetical protein J5F18_16375 [Halomonas sp. BM-2019]